VGKSTLFNRLTGTRRSMSPTNRHYPRPHLWKAEWRGRALEIVDTGGLVPDDKARFRRKSCARRTSPSKKAALLVLVVDSQAGLSLSTEELARLRAHHGQALCDRRQQSGRRRRRKPMPGVFHRIGVPIFRSPPNTHRRGRSLDEALKQTESRASVEEEKQPTSSKSPIIGRPNVGKSTLLNRMVGEERSIVFAIPAPRWTTSILESRARSHVPLVTPRNPP